jgi:type IV pilus assembly protein PilQ
VGIWTIETMRRSPVMPLRRRAGGLLFAGLFGWVLLSLSLVGGIWPSGARGAVVRVLEGVEFSALPGERVQLRLDFSTPAEVPRSFTTDKPARIALDFMNTGNGLAKRTTNINMRGVLSATAVAAGDRTRVVINLVESKPFETRVDGNSLYVMIGGLGPAPASAAPTPRPIGSASVDVPIPVGGPRLEDVDFRRGDKGEGRILITLSRPGIVTDLREEGGKLVMDFFDVSLPRRLERRLDVVDFATPIKEIDTFAHGDNVRMVITTLANFEDFAYQSDNLVTLEVRPISKEKQEELRKEKFGYTGERLSLNFQNIDIRAVLQLLADFTNLNIVVSDAVQGSLTLRLKNVPWDQALDIILKTKGLDKRITGNVMLVAPAEELSSREKLELESQQQVRELVPLRSEFIQINYAKAADIADLLKSSENSLLSSRGKVSVDERTNALLVLDTGEKLEEIRKLVKTLDVPVRQVMIDSRIVIADKGFAKDLGVRFGVTGVTQNNGDLITTTGSGRGTNQITNEAIDNAQSDGSFYPVTPPILPSDRYNVNLPAVPPNANPGSLAFAVLGSRYLLDLELTALQSDNRGEIISNPRVITANQHEAVIKQGEQIPYQQATSSGATSVSFKDAVLQLKVLPQITPDDRILLELTVSQDSRGADTVAGPAINTQEVDTQVLVNNGDTVVLGGIYQQTRQRNVDGIPYLSEIPVVGFLFRSTGIVDNKRELLIFVTPKVLKEELSLE